MSPRPDLSQLPAPPVPADCDIRGMPWTEHRAGMFTSEDSATVSAAVFRARVLLWEKSLELVPAGSVPDDDNFLAHNCQFRGAFEFNKVKQQVLAEHILCSDGRWHHRERYKIVLKAWEHREKETARKAAFRAKSSQTEPNVPWDNQPEDQRPVRVSRGTDVSPSRPSGGIEMNVPRTTLQYSREDKHLKRLSVPVPRAREAGPEANHRLHLVPKQEARGDADTDAQCLHGEVLLPDRPAPLSNEVPGMGDQLGRLVADLQSNAAQRTLDAYATPPDIPLPAADPTAGMDRASVDVVAEMRDQAIRNVEMKNLTKFGARYQDPDPRESAARQLGQLAAVVAPGAKPSPPLKPLKDVSFKGDRLSELRKRAGIPMMPAAVKGTD